MGFLLCSLAASAQIIDDSTRLVYGAHTSLFTLESKIRENDSTLQALDSTLINMENFELIKKTSAYYQDLGVNGTAMFPMFYTIPKTIGRRSGFYAYDPYMILSENFRYYNTKSPMLLLNVGFGGNGRSIVDFNFFSKHKT